MIPVKAKHSFELFTLHVFFAVVRAACIHKINHKSIEAAVVFNFLFGHHHKALKNILFA